MTKEDFRISISAPVASLDAYDKIARVSEWWAKDFQGSAQNAGDEFKVTFKETWVNFKVTEADPGEKVVWSVTDCYLPWLVNKTEWTGTRVVFELNSDPDGTTVTMTHEGLTPEVECYDACHEGWTRHVATSLKQFLIDGHGIPQ